MQLNAIGDRYLPLTEMESGYGVGIIRIIQMSPFLPDRAKTLPVMAQ